MDPSRLGATKLTKSQNYLAIVSMRIKMQGFIVLDHIDEYAEARKQLAQWLSEGKIKRKETMIKGGLQNVEAAFECLFKGKNIGKSAPKKTQRGD